MIVVTNILDFNVWPNDVNLYVKQSKNLKDNIQQKKACVTRNCEYATESHDPRGKVQYHYPCVKGVDD